MTTQRTLSTIKQFSGKYPAFSEGSLRYLVFNARQNGIDSAVLRVGKKLLIDEERFFVWLDALNEKSARRA